MKEPRDCAAWEVGRSLILCSRIAVAYSPWGLFCLQDSRSGVDVFVSAGDRVVHIHGAKKDFKQSTFWGPMDQANVIDVAVFQDDGQQFVAIVDTGQHVIHVVGMDGKHVESWGVSRQKASKDGDELSVRFSSPVGVAFGGRTAFVSTGKRLVRGARPVFGGQLLRAAEDCYVACGFVPRGCSESEANERRSILLSDSASLLRQGVGLPY